MRFVFLIPALSLLLFAAPVLAQDSDHAAAPRVSDVAAPPSADELARAAQLKRSGDALMDELKYTDALAAYEKAYAVSADPALLYNAGRALEAMGEFPRALAKLEQFSKAAPPSVKAQVPALDELITDVKSRVSTLVVHCNVGGARVMLRDRLVGEIRGSLEASVRAGVGTIEVSAEGYESFRKSLDLPGADSVVVEVKLVERHDLAALTVRATPQGSLVFIDAKPHGPVPVDVKLAPGAHSVVLKYEGYNDERVDLALAAGDRRTLDITLRTPPPITARWWFWTAVGTAVVGGVVLTAALLTEKSPGSGDFSPGQLRGP